MRLKRSGHFNGLTVGPVSTTGTGKDGWEEDVVSWTTVGHTHLLRGPLLGDMQNEAIVQVCS